MSHSEWWRGLPLWLKAVDLILALPAWLFIVFCVVTGQNKSTAALGAFAVCVVSTLLHVTFDRRRGGSGHEGNGFTVGDGDI